MTRSTPSYTPKCFSGSLSYLPNSLTMSPHTYEKSSLIFSATRSESSAGIEFSPRSRRSCCTNDEMSRPAMGMCLIEEPIT